MLVLNNFHVHLNGGETKHIGQRTRQSNSDHFSSDRLRFSLAFWRLTCFDGCPTNTFLLFFFHCGGWAIQLCDAGLRGGGSVEGSWLLLLLLTADKTFVAIIETTRRRFFIFFAFPPVNFSTAATRIDRPPGSADTPRDAGAPKCQPGRQLTS